MSTFREEIPSLAEALEGKAPAEILGAVAARLQGRIALACSFGVEDCVLVDAVARSRLPIEVFTIDTGFLFAETYALWARLEERYGIRIRAVKAEHPALDAARPRPWEEDPDACCDARKVRPLRAALAELGGWVTGIRRDQTPERAGARVVEWDDRFGLAKVNPLAAWTSDRVSEHALRHDVPTNPLHARGYLSIGCAPCTSPVAPGEDPRSGRWRGREKTECGLHADRSPPRSPQPRDANDASRRPRGS